MSKLKFRFSGELSLFFQHRISSATLDMDELSFLPIISRQSILSNFQNSHACVEKALRGMSDFEMSVKKYAVIGKIFINISQNTWCYKNEWFIGGLWNNFDKLL